MAMAVNEITLDYYECKVTGFRKTAPSDEDIVYHQKDHPIQLGDMIGFSPHKGKYILHILNKVDKGPKDTLSFDMQLFNQLGINQNKPLQICKFKREDVILDVMDVIIKDQYFSRNDMFLFSNKMRNLCVHENKKVEFSGFRGTVGDLWCSGKNVMAGYVDKNTRVVYRSKSAVVHLFLQISHEMATFDSFGDRHFDKALKFIEDLFNKWNEYMCGHDVTIVLFSRIYAKSPNSIIKEKLKEDKYGRYFQDFYSVVVQNERYMLSEWKKVMNNLKRRYEEYIDELESFMANLLGTNEGTIYELSSAYESNVLETLNMTLNLYESYYIDRNFDRTGKICIVITAGSGVFKVDKNLTDLTKQRICDLGIGIDLVCVGEQPLHAVPLFIYENEKDALNDDFYLPYWINHSFYRSEREMQAIRTNQFVPRINIQIIHQQLALAKAELARNHNYYVSREGKFRRLREDERPEQGNQSLFLNRRDFTNSEFMNTDDSNERTDDSNLAHKPIVGLEEMLEPISLGGPNVEDENDATNIGISNQDYFEGASNHQSSAQVTVSQSQPQTQSGHSTTNISVNIRNQMFHGTNMSGTTTSSLAVQPRSLLLTNRPPAIDESINPFKSGPINIRTNTNSRRWTHVFPVDEHNKPIQLHHKINFYPKEAKQLKLKTRDKNELRGVAAWAEYYQRFFTLNPDYEEQKKKRYEELNAIIHERREKLLERMRARGEPMPQNIETFAVRQDIERPQCAFLGDLLGENQEPETFTTQRASGQSISLAAPAVAASQDTFSTGQQSFTEEDTDTLDESPINHMENNPFQLIGVDWKSLTMPALLPITSDYFPDNQTLNNDFMENNYTLVPQSLELVDSINLTHSAWRKPLTNDETYREIKFSRLNQDFQLVTQPPSWKKRERPETSRSRESTDTVRFCIGRTYHSITKQNDCITVNQYSKRNTNSFKEASYIYCMKMPDSRDYMEFKTNFRLQRNFNWNFHDNYILTYGSSIDSDSVNTYQLQLNERFWRSRFLLIPTNSTTKQLTEMIGRQLKPNCDIYEEKSIVDQDNITEEFFKFMELVNRFKRRIQSSRKKCHKLSSVEAQKPVAMTKVNSCSSNLSDMKRCGIQSACIIPQKPSRSISSHQAPNIRSSAVSGGHRYSVVSNDQLLTSRHTDPSNTMQQINNNSNLSSPVTPVDKIPRQFTFDSADTSTSETALANIEEPLSIKSAKERIIRSLEHHETGLNFLPNPDTSAGGTAVASGATASATPSVSSSTVTHISVQHPIFTGHTCVHWLLANMGGIANIQDAINFLQQFVLTRDFININSVACKKFAYGFVMYMLNTHQAGRRVTSASVDALLTDSFDPNSKTKRGVFEWAEVLLAIPTINGKFENEWIERYISTHEFKYEWTINRPSLIEFPKFEFLLQDLPMRKLTNLLNLENFEMYTGKIPHNANMVFENGVLYRKVMLDIDNSDEQRSEWGLFQHEANFHPTTAFEFTVHWLVATGIRISDKLNVWTRRLSSLQLIPVPCDPFALPSSINSDPLRGPIFVPLNLSHLIEPNFDSKDVTVAVEKLFPEFFRQEHKYRLMLFQEVILKKFGFVKTNCVTYTTLDYDLCLEQKGQELEPNRRVHWTYVHCSGGMFAMIPDYPELVVRSDDPHNEWTGNRWDETGFLWSWNKMLPKKIQKTSMLADEAFQDHMLANFRSFCAGGPDDTRLKKLYDDAVNRTTESKNCQ